MSIPEAHPDWCDREHTPDNPVHSIAVGAEDIEINADRDLSVGLYQHDTDPPQVWVCEHSRSRDETAAIPLTVEQAAELGRRLLDAAARTRPPVPPTTPGDDWTDTGSGPGWAR